MSFICRNPKLWSTINKIFNTNCLYSTLTP